MDTLATNVEKVLPLAFIQDNLYIKLNADLIKEKRGMFFET